METVEPRTTVDNARCSGQGAEAREAGHEIERDEQRACEPGPQQQTRKTRRRRVPRCACPSDRRVEARWQTLTKIRKLLVGEAQKASLEKEMSLARQVQQAMLPPQTLDQHGDLKVVGYCMPASSCGGDWWTYRKLSNGRMLLVVGDATGHGIHSAMIAATARGAVEALSGIDERLLTPEQVLKAIDSAIRQVGDHNVMMTAFAAVFDSVNGILLKCRKIGYPTYYI